MRRKGIFTLLTAVFMVLVFSAVTFAANQVVLKTTVPNIPLSTCYKAGTDTMEMDHLTKMNEGDKITFTLTNGVTVCKDINFFLSLGTGGAVGTTADLAVSASNAGDLLVPVGLVAGTDIGFVVKATNGDLPANQIITLELRSRVIATGVLQAPVPARTIQFNAAGGDPSTDRLIVKLFDGKTTVTQLFKPDAVGAYIYTSATAAPNTFVPENNNLCIDTLTQPWSDGANVENTPDSLPGNAADKLGFSGDYRIAHILGTVGYDVVSCGGKSAVGHVFLGKTGQPDTCRSFDFEDAPFAGSNGYCADHAVGNKLVIASTLAWDVTNYTVTAQIVVERGGVAKAIPGVYWSNIGFTSAGYATLALACAGAGPVAVANDPTLPYALADGATLAAPRLPSAASCALTAAQKAVYWKSAPASLTIAAGQTHLYLNMPDFNYDPAELLPGDVVRVKVTLNKVGCGSIGPLFITVGTIDCAAGPVVGSSCFFPYITSLHAGDTFVSGIALVNTGTTVGTVTLTATKKDGTKSTYTTDPIGPGATMGPIFVSAVPSINWVGTTPAEMPAFIQAASATIPAGQLSAFGFMFDGKSDSMGYVPDCK